MSQPPKPPATPLPRGVIAWLLLVLTMLVLSSVGDFRTASESRLDTASDRAIAAFAVARTINAVVSVIQETQVGVSLGINTTIEPGQILDPLNDLIERFSTAALIAGTLLWALKLLGGFLLVPWLPAILLVLLLIRVGLERCAGCDEPRRMLLRIVRVGSVIWLFAALTPWVIDGVHSSAVIQQHYQAASQSLENAGSQLRSLADVTSPWNIDREQLFRNMDELVKMADRLSRQAIIVLAVFVFEVLLVPLAIFWISSRVLLQPRLR